MGNEGNSLIRRETNIGQIEVILFVARALAEFEAAADDELSLVAGDIVSVIQKINDEWLEGSLNGKVFIWCIVSKASRIHLIFSFLRHTRNIIHYVFFSSGTLRCMKIKSCDSIQCHLSDSSLEPCLLIFPMPILLFPI